MKNIFGISRIGSLDSRNGGRGGEGVSCERQDANKKHINRRFFFLENDDLLVNLTLIVTNLKQVFTVYGESKAVKKKEGENRKNFSKEIRHRRFLVLKSCKHIPFVHTNVLIIYVSFSIP